MQNLCSSKDKNPQQTAARAAAAKLEQYAHTPAQTPPKKGSQPQTKLQQGDRKSLGQGQSQLTAIAPQAQSTKPHSNKNPGMSKQKAYIDVLVEPGLPADKEPTLTDVFLQ